MDWTNINARMEEMARQRKEQLAASRIVMLADLLKVGITRIEATYDGCGDSGNIEDVTIEPEGTKLDAHQEEKLRDFLWGVPYNLHPGFEINEGGYGDVTWDLTADKIDVSHGERFVDTNHYEHEDV